MRLSICCLLVLCFLPLFAQEQSNKPRVFITDSQSWELGGGVAGVDGTFAGAASGGARPQTAEVIKTFAERCPQVTINNIKEKADYVVLLDHEGGKSPIVRDNKVAVFNRDGDSIVSKSTRSLGNAVKDVCDAINTDWPKFSHKVAASVSAAPGADKPVELAANEVSVSSTPVGADIELDGEFVGSTPSVIDIPPGEHTIVVTKEGYKAWQRKMKTTGGAINVVAELEKSQ